MTPPLVVVEASVHAFEHAVVQLEALGWRVVRGWSGGVGSICAGPVASTDEAAEAVLAAVAGAGIVAHARGGRELVDRLVDDLRRFGRVEHRTAEPAGPRLTRDEERLLALLLDGETLGAAAARLHLSRRTADRRLASARRKLGAASTSAAIVAYAAALRRRAGPRRPTD